MKFTTELNTYTSGRAVWVDMGWPACDERLVTLAEAIAHSGGGATAQWLDVR